MVDFTLCIILTTIRKKNMKVIVLVETHLVRHVAVPLLKDQPREPHPALPRIDQAMPFQNIQAYAGIPPGLLSPLSSQDGIWVGTQRKCLCVLAVGGASGQQAPLSTPGLPEVSTGTS